MMFNKFTALALLAVVTVLAASACGRPSSDGSGDVAAANHGGSRRMGVVHGWLKGSHEKAHENHRDCGFSGGVLGWARGKLGFGPKTTGGGSTTTETAAAPLPTNAYEVTVEVTDDEDRVQPAVGTAGGQDDDNAGSGVDADDRDNADETTTPSAATVVEAVGSEDASPKTDGDESVAATAVTVASGDTSAENALTEDIDPRMAAQN